MARFCSKCGTPVDGLNFCPNCGNALGSSPAPTGQSPFEAASSATTGASGGNSTPPSPPGSATKIVLAIFGVLGLFALVAIAGVVYEGHRVSQKAREFTRQYGLESGATVGGLGVSSARSGNFDRDACSLVTKDEVAGAIGSRITKAVNDGVKSRCIYKASNGTQVGLEVRNGAAGVIAGNRLASKIMSGKNASVDVPGIGDEAVAMPMNSGLVVRKGETVITVDMRMAPKNLEDAKAIARKALSRL